MKKILLVLVLTTFSNGVQAQCYTSITFGGGHPWINNHDRGHRRIWNLKGYQEVDDKESNTFQTYIFMTTRK